MPDRTAGQEKGAVAPTLANVSSLAAAFVAGLDCELLTDISGRPAKGRIDSPCLLGLDGGQISPMKPTGSRGRGSRGVTRTGSRCAVRAGTAKESRRVPGSMLGCTTARLLTHL